MKTKTDSPKFWSVDSQSDRLNHTDMNEAVAEYLEYFDNKDWPEFIEMQGYAPFDISHERDQLVTRILDDVIEGLDEEYGDPDGDYSEITPTMKQAAEAFIDTVLQEYEPWACEAVCATEINVEEWVRQNRPEWLETDESIP